MVQYRILNGIQGRYLTEGWRRLGHEVAYFAFWGLQGAKINAEGFQVYPPHRYTWGEDIVRAHMEHFRADACITLWDIWVVNDDYAEQAYPWICWTPVDQYPAPPLVIERAKQAYQVLVYSRFGQEAMREQGVETVYIPHAVDCQVYKPMDKLECRRRLGFADDAFVIGMVAANKGHSPCRKAFPEALLAFQEFRRRHSDAVMYLHTDLEGHDGVDIRAIIESLGLPKGAIKAVDQYRNVIGLPPQYLADAYNAMNVLHAASMGEGFGLTILEGQACGTRVVTTNWTSMPELTFDGICTEPAQRYWTKLDSWAVVPSVANIIEAWEAIYRGELGNPMSHSLVARARAEEYEWGRVVDQYWKPFLEELEVRLTEEREAKRVVAGVSWPREEPKAEVDIVSFQPQGCEAGDHDWARVGLWQGDELCVPCLRGNCAAELRIHRVTSRRTIVPDGFKMERHGIALDIEDDPQGGVAKIVYREIESSYDVSSIPFEPGDVVLDIGAHVGVVSIYLAKLYPDVKIYAFEPITVNLLRLSRNRNVNLAENVVFVGYAVSADGRRLELRGRASENSGGFSALVSGDGDEYVVVSMTLEEIFERYVPQRCKLLKMDIEGMEYEVLEAHCDLLKRVDYLALEAHQSEELIQQRRTVAGLKALCSSYLPGDRLRFCVSGLG